MYLIQFCNIYDCKKAVYFDTMFLTTIDYKNLNCIYFVPQNIAKQNDKISL